MTILPMDVVVMENQNQLAVLDKPNEFVMQVKHFCTINCKPQNKTHYCLQSNK
jgi:hypothetical protein